MRRSADFDPLSKELVGKQLKIVTGLVLAVFGVLVLNLWSLQIVQGPMYRKKSENNRILLKDLPAPRGMIFDRQGDRLVGNSPTYDLYIIPEEVKKRDELLKELAGLTGLDPGKAKEELAEAGDLPPFMPVCVHRDMSRDELARIETRQFNMPGVMIKVSPKRHYEYGKLASHLLGYMGEVGKEQLKKDKYKEVKPGELVGKSGVELRWDKSLRGKRGGEQVEVDAAGRRLRVTSRKSPVQGADVYLTIDRRLQERAEKALAEKNGAVVAMDPSNGQILAMASRPSYNPNIFVRGIDRKTWNKLVLSQKFPLENRAIAGQYPPGSVFKIAVSLAGLEEGVIDPDKALSCSGVYRLGRRRYHCWKKYGHGEVPFHRALRESCDIYFYKLGRRLGVDAIAEWARMLGLGSPTGLEVGREKGGLIPTRKWKKERFGVSWQGGETLSTAIGQSFVLVTPIQMARLISTVFNGGTIYRPQATLRVEKPGGEVIHEFAPEVIGRLDVEKEHLELVKKGLVAVVNEPHGTGWRARLKDVTVAGKTGTAQVVSLKRTEAFKDEEVPEQFKDHAWFVAIAPADDPEIAVSVLVEHGGHGGSAAAPIAKEVIKVYLGEDSAGEEPRV